MSAEIIAAASAASSAAGDANTTRMVDLQSHNVNSTVASSPTATTQSRFDAAMDRISSINGTASTTGMPKAMSGMIGALDKVNVQAKSVSDYAKSAADSGGTMTPGEIVNLTMRCQEFMFQCQLTSNIANRSADGVQQLFRQQG